MSIRNLSNDRPSITLNFKRAKKLDPRVTFSRASFAPANDPTSGSADNVAGSYNMFNVDVPRLTDQGLLIEESRTNYLQYNSDFSNAAWFKRGSPATAAPVTTAPDGTLTAQGVAISPAANTYVLSVYTPQTGIAGGLQSTNLTSEWQYYSEQYTYVNSTDRFSVYPVQLGPNNYISQELLGIVPTGTVTVSGWAKTDGSNIWMWGVQAEEGAFPTSMIPTTTAPVTRAADFCTITDDNFTSYFNFADHTTVVEWDRGSLNQRSWVYRYMQNANRGSDFLEQIAINADSSVGANAWWGQSDFGNITDINGKAALAVSDGSASFGVGGTLISPTSPRPPSSGPTTRMVIGRTEPTAEFLNGYLKRIGFYPTRLPDSALQGLTYGDQYA